MHTQQEVHRRRPLLTAKVRKSVGLKKHMTSVRIELAFWDALQQIADEHSTSINALINKIDGHKNGDSLSSTIRVYCLQYFRDGLNHHNGYSHVPKTRSRRGR